MECPMGWDNAGNQLRITIVKHLGWTISNGNTSRLGNKIAKTDWELLSSATKTVLQRHGIKQ